MDELKEWLDGLGLSGYARSFAKQKVGFDLLPQLDDADLKELGVRALGDRKRLLKAIAAMKRQRGDGATSAESKPCSVATHTEVATSREAEGERRQLTVMFCDLVGSTALASKLDPEALQGIIRSYHGAAASAVASYAGHVAQYLGDGVLVYFGYPRAHEDDAERALRAALDVLKAVVSLRPHGNIELQTRIGIATGLVVVGEIGGGTSAAEQTASGETPNLAARLQAQAKPGEIVISAATRRLVGASFELESLGELKLRGFAAPAAAWRVLGERAVASRFEAQHQSQLSPFIGRDSEVALLLERWTLARDGEGPVVLLTGEAGVGKSRICQAFREHLAGETYGTVQLQCSPYFSNSALYPVTQYLERAAGINASDDAAMRAGKLEAFAGKLPAELLGSLLRVMSLPDGGRVPASGQTPQQEKVRTLQALTELLLAVAQRQPVLLLIEDAHWIDPTTEELFGLVIDRLRDERVLTVITTRPEYAATFLGNRAQLTRLTLNRLGRMQCVTLIAAIAEGKSLPADVLDEIVSKTDGIPLFVEELTKTVLQSGLLEEAQSSYRLSRSLTALAIPSTLQDSLMARLDQLAPAKQVAQAGSVIGRKFARRLLAAVLQMTESDLDEALDELVRSELVSGAGQDRESAVYTFKHALISDTAYNSMLKSQRALHHGRIADVLLRDYPEVVAAQPELLAHHYEESRNTAAAFKYWLAAGDLAASRSASREASCHYRAALALLPASASERTRAELEFDLQLKLGSTLIQLEGGSSQAAYACYARVRDLGLSLGQLDRFMAALIGMGPAKWATGRYSDTIDLVQILTPEDMARIKPVSRAIYATGIGISRLHPGNLRDALELFLEAGRLFDLVEPKDRPLLNGVDPTIMVRVYVGRTLTLQGFLEQGDRCIAEALDIVERGGSSHSRAYVLQQASRQVFLKGDIAEAARHARQAFALAESIGFKATHASSSLSLGRALVAAGQLDEGIGRLRDGYSRWCAAAGKFQTSEHAALAAEVLLNSSHVDVAAEFVSAGEILQADSEERYCHAELLRLRGRLCELQGEGDRAEECYRAGIEISEKQGAKLFCLRGATDLAKRLASVGKASKGTAILRPIYGWFTEGFDYPDLMRAKSTLDRLAEL